MLGAVFLRTFDATAFNPGKSTAASVLMFQLYRDGGTGSARLVSMAETTRLGNRAATEIKGSLAAHRVHVPLVDTVFESSRGRSPS